MFKWLRQNKIERLEIKLVGLFAEQKTAIECINCTGRGSPALLRDLARNIAETKKLIEILKAKQEKENV